MRNFKLLDREAVTKNRLRVKKKRETGERISANIFYINTIIDTNSNFTLVAFDTVTLFLAKTCVVPRTCL